jgi:phosphoribosyl 1,2-cyclic phosphodiesterase
MSFKVKFWGVRGSIACPSPNHVVYGGNTSCIQVSLNGHTVILDAGTGIRSLGQSLVKRQIQKATLLLTHTHWDHINGFPFFTPAYSPSFSLDIYAGHLNDKGGIKHILASQMANPTFPVPFSALRAQLDFTDFHAGDLLDIHEDVTVKTAPLNHPNGATAYRIEHGGRSFCFVTDTEHVPDKPDENVLGLIEGADLVVYDSTYTDAEFPAKVGWGHSTWQEGVRLCRRANVKKMAIFHHDPEHDDQFMEELEDEARRTWEGIIVARDNMELTLT